jgi:glycosyltransferase domain-containing protein
MKNELTVLVPTHNRPAFLNRLLNYLATTSLQSPILIIDSSDPERLELNRQVIRQVGNSLRIVHRIDTAGLIKKCRFAMSEVKTAYSIFCADDDFLFADSAYDCVDFLNRNVDYSAAMGSWVWFNSAKNNSCHQSKCRSLEQIDPLDRFQSLATRWFSTFYAVHRTEDLRNAWNVADDSSDYDQARVYPELMLGQLGMLAGKLKILPCLHMIFQLHDDNEHRRLPLIQNPATQQALYKRFADALADQMVITTACSRAEAFQILSHLYGSTGDRLVRDNGRPVGLHRLRRNIWNQFQLIRDRISSDPTNIWIRRRMSENHPLRQTQAWKTAFDIAVEFPEGIEPAHDTAGRFAA